MDAIELPQVTKSYHTDPVCFILDFGLKLWVNKIAGQIKRWTTHSLKKEYPFLKSRLPSLWTRSKFISTDRIYPTVEQQEHLAIQFGLVRFAYNKIRSYRKKEYAQFGRRISHYQSITFLAKLKRMEKYAWMKKADSQALQQAVIDLG